MRVRWHANHEQGGTGAIVEYVRGGLYKTILLNTIGILALVCTRSLALAWVRLSVFQLHFIRKQSDNA